MAQREPAASGNNLKPYKILQCASVAAQGERRWGQFAGAADPFTSLQSSSTPAVWSHWDHEGPRATMKLASGGLTAK